MGYWKKRWRNQNRTIIIEDKYHSARMMPKNPLIQEKRRPRTGKATTETQEKINLRHRTEKYSRLIMDNFQAGDWWVTFKLAKNVSVSAFKKAYSSMIREMRTFYRKHGHELKYLAVHENLTGRGRLHGHILIPALPGVPFIQMMRMMSKAWTLGDCHFKPYEGTTMDAIRVAGRAEVQFTAKAQPDFIGCMAGGRLLAFESKYTQSDHIRQDAVTKTQAAMLEKYHQIGAASGVCCGIGTGFDLKYFMVPWETWKNMKKLYGHKYATADELQNYEVKADGVIHFMDYKSKPIRKQPIA